jgi:hypothetical protein
VLRKILVLLLGLGLSGMACAQQQPGQPPVKVNVLNVCTPGTAEQQEIAAALAKVPQHPAFVPDFEVSRGRSSLEENPGFLQAGGGAQFSSGSETAEYVRIRHELARTAFFSTVQYSFSRDPKNMVETLVFQVRDPKDLMQVSVEDSASTVTSAATMLAASTPASRIKLERFGKSSVVLARCIGSEAGPAPDQSAYEPLFLNASAVMADYRRLLGAQHMVPEELAKVGGAAGHAAHSQNRKRPAQVK